MAVTKIAAVLLVVGLVVGVVAGYGVGFINYQPQISQLQSDLSETESALSKSQSEVESLRGQLTETKNKLTATEAKLKDAQTNIASLESKLMELETNYTSLSYHLNVLKHINDELTTRLEGVLWTTRDPDPQWFFGANMRVGLDAFSFKTKEELVLQFSAAHLMRLNCLRIVFDPWKYVRPFQHLSDEIKKNVKQVVDSIWKASARIIFTFDKIMWMSSDSDKYWIGYKQYKDAIVDVVNLLRDHPSIVAYDLSNEPVLAIELARLKGDITSDVADSWIKELKEVYAKMAEDIRSIDDQVLITVGEGLPEHSSHFKEIVDFISFHDTGMWSPYPEENTWDGTPENLRTRLKKRIEIAKSYGKPVVLEEYGTDPEYVYEIQRWRLGKVIYQPIDYWRVILEEVQRERIGAMFWVININAGDSWNIAVDDSGGITEIGRMIQIFSAAMLKERLSEN